MSEPVPLELLSEPEKVVEPLVVPTVSVFDFKSTVEDDAPVSEAPTSAKKSARPRSQPEP